MTGVTKPRIPDRRNSKPPKRSSTSDSSTSLTRSDSDQPRQLVVEVSKDQRLHHPGQRPPITTSPTTRSSFISIPLAKPSPRYPHHNLLAYTQWVDTLVDDVHEKYEQATIAANRVSGIDWRVREVIEDGPNDEQQLDGRDGLDERTKRNHPSELEASSAIHSSSEQQQRS